ncbi:hypothetical protein B0H67DRAFT_495542 [Lasiosphaeris hirsuta]|uniref:Concanavalin a-like lectins glucanase n=1 Tax=Lasiosphaeris hirsuta TaxID=260670 RepID=A0AA40A1T5_9PEZI|nr:hypothetical protein B0H67DRAFT_495542 [Lasiosphaeris hirsuta]
MGISQSTARWLAPLSFVVDFAAQNYGMLSSPNMKDVHDANLSFFSPQPFFIAGFFLPQQILQVAWLYRLCRKNAGSNTNDPVGQEDISTMVDFSPYYALGNFCIASWMLFWNRSNLKTSNIFVVINSLAQLYYIFTRLPPMNLNSANSVLTHIVAKTFAGIGVLDLLHNGSVAYFNHQDPGTMVKVLTAVGFCALASSSDWIFGGCLVYDLIALAVGQRQYGNDGWSNLLAMYAGGTAALVILKNLSKPPYLRSSSAGYQSLSSGLPGGMFATGTRR